MSELAVIVLEGVLAQYHDHLPSSKPYPDALLLYEALRRQWQPAVVTAVADPEMTRHWCKLNGFKGFEVLDCRQSWEPDPQVWFPVTLIERYRALGWTVGLFVDGDPARVAAALAQGVTGVLVAHPAYSRPEWRPDASAGPRKWTSLVREVEHQAEMKATDKRLNPPEGDEAWGAATGGDPSRGC
jgi:beta-phosphoglucomutase-like phosphatase (HAD superfamily)